MEMFRRSYADINIENLIHNWNQIRTVAGDDRFICPMVKANAYGHGDVQVSLALEREGARGLGVCLIEEGLLLRASGIKTEILVFRGFDKRGAEKILEYQLIPVVSTWEQLNYLEATADDPVKVHVKFNTGMNRIGFNTDQCEKIGAFFKKSKKLKLRAVLTHLACGEDSHLADGYSAMQMTRFLDVVSFFKSPDVYVHLLNSAGIEGFAKAKAGTTGNRLFFEHQWGFRPGLMLYGYQSAPHFSEIDLKPVMSLKSVVNNIRHIEAGESVSYGGTWVAQRPSEIAVVPIGYADGIHRLVSNRSVALFAGQKVPIIGRVCMDFLMLDVTDVVKDSDTSKWIENEVVLFGFDEKNNLLPATEMAEKTSTIVWETLTSVGERVPRHFKGLKKS